MNTDSSESRRYKRFQPDFDVEVLESSLETRPAVRIADMSCAGLSIETPLRLSMDDPVGIRIALPGGKIFKSQALVRWSRPDGLHYAYGLELQGVRFWDRDRLSRCLDPRYFGLVELGDCALRCAVLVVGAHVLRQWSPSDRYAIFSAKSRIPDAFLVGSMGIYALLSFRRSHQREGR